MNLSVAGHIIHGYRATASAQPSDTDTLTFSVRSWGSCWDSSKFVFMSLSSQFGTVTASLTTYRKTGSTRPLLSDTYKIFWIGRILQTVELWNLQWLSQGIREHILGGCSSDLSYVTSLRYTLKYSLEKPGDWRSYFQPKVLNDDVEQNFISINWFF